MSGILSETEAEAGEMGSFHALVTEKEGSWCDGESNSHSRWCSKLTVEFSSGIE